MNQNGANNQVGGWLFLEDDFESLSRTQTVYCHRALADLPDEVDPRKHPSYGSGFLRTENQGSIGSCAGNALTECAEYSWTIETGRVMQFCRMFAYLETQKKDGIRGDRGSTISGGTKVARDVGFCPEADSKPYPRRYPGHSWSTGEMREAAKRYRMGSHTVLRNPDEAKAYIGDGLGIVQIGIRWGRSMSPDSRGCISSFRVGGGGHSVVLAGYVPDSVVGRSSGDGYWFLLKNSWGTRWGIEGWAYVAPKAVNSMMRSSYSSFVGRSDMGNPEPRPDRVDFEKMSRWA